MTLEQFLLLISWIFNVIFTFLSFIYNIQLTNSIKFGPVCVIFLIFMLIMYVIFRPFSKK